MFLRKRRRGIKFRSSFLGKIKFMCWRTHAFFNLSCAAGGAREVSAGHGRDWWLLIQKSAGELHP